MGTYPGADIAQFQCTSCPKGYALNRDAKVAGGVCDACVCDACTVGTYTDETKQLECKTCPEGTTSASEATEAAADCSTCLAGRYRESTTSGCSVCGSGQIRTETTAKDKSSTCTECDAGSYILPA